MKEMIGAYEGQRSGGAQLSGRRSPARSRGASQNDVPTKQQRAGEGEASGDTDADVMDLATQVQRKLSTQLESRVRDLETET